MKYLKMIMLDNLFCYLFLFSLLAIPIWAQQKQGKVLSPFYRKVEDMTTVDTASIRIWYALNADSIKDEETYIDLQSLEIGNKLSKYYSHFVSRGDSLCELWWWQHPYAQSGPKRWREGGKKPLFWSEYQYSEYFKYADKLVEYARMPFAMKKYDCFYSEPYPLQEWKILSDTLTVNGFLCQKATCNFRGRDYIAWFTLDIPVGNGPWKFGGLPGLILKVYDTKLLYTFECTKIDTQKVAIKTYDYSSYQPMDRNKLLKLQYAINENYLKTSRAVSRTGKKFVSTPYDLLELY